MAGAETFGSSLEDSVSFRPPSPTIESLHSFAIFIHWTVGHLVDCSSIVRVFDRTACVVAKAIDSFIESM